MTAPAPEMTALIPAHTQPATVAIPEKTAEMTAPPPFKRAMKPSQAALTMATATVKTNLTPSHARPTTVARPDMTAETAVTPIWKTNLMASHAIFKATAAALTTPTSSRQAPTKTPPMTRPSPARSPGSLPMSGTIWSAMKPVTLVTMGSNMLPSLALASSHFADNTCCLCASVSVSRANLPVESADCFWIRDSVAAWVACVVSWPLTFL